MTAIKMFVTIRSLPHLSKQEFHDHWRHPHGTWGRGIANIVSYIQCHRIDTPHLDSSQAEIDGVVEVGFENAEDVAGMSEDPAYLGFLKPDEPNFVENAGLSFTDEAVLRSGQRSVDGRWPWREAEQPLSVKLIQVSKGDVRNPAQSDERAMGEAIGALRHVRATPNPGLHPQLDANAITEIRQLWWPTQSDLERGIARDPAAWRELIAAAPGRYTGLFQAERFI